MQAQPKIFEPPSPTGGFLRLRQVLELVPVSQSTWWRMVRDGRAPPKVRLSSNIVAWRADEIREWAAQLAKTQQPSRVVNA